MGDTDVLIGAHGAGLAWGGFLPRGAAVLELVSFGAQPEYFQYFSGLYGLPNDGVDYFQWQNNNATTAYGPLDQLVRNWGILSMSEEDILDCLGMPIKRHPYFWGSHCLNYWRDHDNGVSLVEVGELTSRICCNQSLATD